MQKGIAARWICTSNEMLDSKRFSPKPAGRLSHASSFRKANFQALICTNEAEETLMGSYLTL
jgi:hypothetical protein